MRSTTSAALHLLFAGASFVASSLHVFAQPLNGSYTIGGVAPDFATPQENLTPTERRILGLVAQGKTSKDIADEIGIAYRTVETHRTNIATKLNIHGTHSLLKFALDNKAGLTDE